MADDGMGEVRTRVEGRVLAIEVDREAKRNAFTPQMMAQLSEALTRLDAED